MRLYGHSKMVNGRKPWWTFQWHRPCFRWHSSQWCLGPFLPRPGSVVNDCFSKQMRSKLLKITNWPPRLQVLRGALQGAACPAGPTFQSKKMKMLRKTKVFMCNSLSEENEWVTREAMIGPGSDKEGGFETQNQYSIREDLTGKNLFSGAKPKLALSFQFGWLGPHFLMFKTTSQEKSYKLI